MLNVFLLTYFTKKLDLVIIEKNSSITDKWLYLHKGTKCATVLKYGLI